MNSLKIQLLIVSMVLFASLWCSADVYTWTDSMGQVHYSDIPRTTEDQKVKVKNKRTDNMEIALRKQEKLDAKIASESNAREAQIQRDKEAQKQAREMENCKRARDALASLNLARRLFVADENGERRYLSEEEKADRMRRAKADIAEWCKDPG